MESHTLIRLPADQRPILIVAIDTEEEFDWSREFDRRNTAVGHLSEIEKLQGVFDEFGVRPVYVIDYPVAAQEEAALRLKAIQDAGRAEIGAHLHPWVSPPYDEPVNARNSYPGNVPRDLEAAKLAALTRAIEQGVGMGMRPRSYKAGRYGFGPHTAEILEQLGFEVDLSFSPPFDFGEDGGHDHSGYSADPRWLGSKRGILSIPMTGGYVGFISVGAHRIYRLATHPALSWMHLPGILSRTHALARLRLSPEGYWSEHHRRLTHHLLRRGGPVFTFSLHSPSIKPGCTPYVRDERELAGLLESCRRYLDFFLGRLGGVSMTALELKRYLEGCREPAPA